MAILVDAYAFYNYPVKSRCGPILGFSSIFALAVKAGGTSLYVVMTM